MFGKHMSEMNHRTYVCPRSTKVAGNRTAVAMMRLGQGGGASAPPP